MQVKIDPKTNKLYMDGVTENLTFSLTHEIVNFNKQELELVVFDNLQHESSRNVRSRGVNLM